MSNNGLTPIMTRLRMTLARKWQRRGDEHADELYENLRWVCSFSPVSVLLTPDLSVSTEKKKNEKTTRATRMREGNEEEEDLISPRSPPPVSTLFNSEEPPPLLRPINTRPSFPEDDLKPEDGLTRMNSLNETKLLAVTNLRRQKSNSLPSNFRFDAHFRYERRLNRTASAEVWLVTGLESGRTFRREKTT